MMVLNFHQQYSASQTVRLNYSQVVVVNQVQKSEVKLTCTNNGLSFALVSVFYFAFFNYTKMVHLEARISASPVLLLQFM